MEWRKEYRAGADTPRPQRFFPSAPYLKTVNLVTVSALRSPTLDSASHWHQNPRVRRHPRILLYPTQPFSTMSPRESRSCG
ncbi:hypothetical protein PM082_009620 [Marasmius tenuissimus]|nr:hypothetical protein PM082_009620 [Marasmius tenuissimus]